LVDFYIVVVVDGVAHDEITIAASKCDVGEAEVDLWCLRTALFQLVGGLNVSCLNTETRQPRTG